MQATSAFVKWSWSGHTRRLLRIVSADRIGEPCGAAEHRCVNLA
jgi:hypothetical protein